MSPALASAHLVVAHLVALHLGPLHPVEKVLTLVLAFGPFVVLGIVVAVRRRHESDEDVAGDGDGGDAGERADEGARTATGEDAAQP